MATVLAVVTLAGCSNGRNPPTSLDDPGRACIDNDGDGFGFNCAAVDCDDNNPQVTDQCYRCAHNEPNCPCQNEGQRIECGKVEKRVGNQVTCAMGGQVCTGGKWSECEMGAYAPGHDGVKTQTFKTQTLRTQAIATTPGPCTTNPCAAYCRSFDDDTVGLDVADSGISLGPDGGLTLPATGLSDIPTPADLAALSDAGALPDSSFYFHEMLPGTESTDPVATPTTKALNADVYFLIDDTASMSQEASELRSAIASPSGTIEDLKANFGALVNFGFGRFEEYPQFPYVQDTTANLPFEHLTSIQGDKDVARNTSNWLSFDSFGAAGNEVNRSGGTTPESTMLALFAASGPGAGVQRNSTLWWVPNRSSWVTPVTSVSGGSVLASDSVMGQCPPDSVARYGYPCWRDKALPIFILITDAPSHNGPGGWYSYVNNYMAVTNGGAAGFPPVSPFPTQGYARLEGLPTTALGGAATAFPQLASSGTFRTAVNGYGGAAITPLVTSQGPAPGTTFPAPPSADFVTDVQAGLPGAVGLPAPGLYMGTVASATAPVGSSPYPSTVAFPVSRSSVSAEAYTPVAGSGRSSRRDCRLSASQNICSGTTTSGTTNSETIPRPPVLSANPTFNTCTAPNTQSGDGTNTTGVTSSSPTWPTFGTTTSSTPWANHVVAGAGTPRFEAGPNFTVPANSRLTMTMTYDNAGQGAVPNADLYVKVGTGVTTGSWTCRPASGGTTAETCTIWVGNNVGGVGGPYTISWGVNLVAPGNTPAVPELRVTYTIDSNPAACAAGRLMRSGNTTLVNQASCWSCDTGASPPWAYVAGSPATCQRPACTSGVNVGKTIYDVDTSAAVNYQCCSSVSCAAGYTYSGAPGGTCQSRTCTGNCSNRVCSNSSTQIAGWTGVGWPGGVPPANNINLWCLPEPDCAPNGCTTAPYTTCLTSPTPATPQLPGQCVQQSTSTNWNCATSSQGEGAARNEAVYGFTVPPGQTYYYHFALLTTGRNLAVSASNDTNRGSTSSGTFIYIKEAPVADSGGGTVVDCNVDTLSFYGDNNRYVRSELNGKIENSTSNPKRYYLIVDNTGTGTPSSYNYLLQVGGFSDPYGAVPSYDQALARLRALGAPLGAKVIGIDSSGVSCGQSVGVGQTCGTAGVVNCSQFETRDFLEKLAVDTGTVDNSTTPPTPLVYSVRNNATSCSSGAPNALKDVLRQGVDTLTSNLRQTIVVRAKNSATPSVPPITSPSDAAAALFIKSVTIDVNAAANQSAAFGTTVPFTPPACGTYAGTTPPSDVKSVDTNSGGDPSITPYNAGTGIGYEQFNNCLPGTQVQFLVKYRIPPGITQQPYDQYFRFDLVTVGTVGSSVTELSRTPVVIKVPAVGTNDPQDFVRVYDAKSICPSGSRPVWSSFFWDSQLPQQTGGGKNSSSSWVDFYVATGATQAEMFSNCDAANVGDPLKHPLLATAGGWAPNTEVSSRDVTSVLASYNLPTGQPHLCIRFRLNPSQNQVYQPTLYSWKLWVDCQPAE